MRSKTLLKLLGAIVLAAVIALAFVPGCAKEAPTPAPAPAEPVAIKWVMQPTIAKVPPFGPFKGGMYQNAIYHSWGDWLEEATDGRLTIEIVPPGAIFPLPETLTGVGSGAVDVGHCPPGYFAGKMPEMYVLTGLPGTWNSIGDILTGLYTYGLYDKVKGLYDQYNVTFIPVPQFEVMNILSTFPMPDLDSVKGHKVRGWGPWTKYLEMLDISAVSMPYTDVYTAIKLGTVDGTFSGAQALEDVKLKEVVTDFITDANPCVCCLLINNDSLKALPDDIRTLIVRDSKYPIAWGCQELLQHQRYTAVNAAEEYGITTWKWSEADLRKVRVKAEKEIWPEFAGKSPLCAEMVEIVKKQLKDFGKL